MCPQDVTASEAHTEISIRVAQFAGRVMEPLLVLLFSFSLLTKVEGRSERPIFARVFFFFSCLNTSFGTSANKLVVLWSVVINAYFLFLFFEYL